MNYIKCKERLQTYSKAIHLSSVAFLNALFYFTISPLCSEKNVFDICPNEFEDIIISECTDVIHILYIFIKH